MMNKGKLYGVSVGPGDPELLTLKAIRVLRESDYLAVPNVGTGRQTALGIIHEYTGEKPVIHCTTPMLRDHEEVLKSYREVAAKIARKLDEGCNVAYVAIGDITVYSTYFYIHEMLVANGYEAEIVPGVTSFCAAAARLGIPLCEGKEGITIIPVISGDVEAAMEWPGTKVFMKSGRDLEKVREVLEKHDRMDGASMVANCGLEDEAVFPKFADVPADMTDYFTLVISKETPRD